MGLVFVHPDVSVSKLFCDKFVFTIDYASASHRQHVLKVIKELKSFKSMYAGQFAKVHYKEGIFICPDENKLSERMLVLCGPKKPGKAFLRVSYNPARIYLDGCWSILNELLPGGIDDIPEQARCTRFDATVDITGVHPDQLLAYYSGMQISRSFRKSGHCETLDIGRYGESRRAVIYDLVARRKHLNEKHIQKLPVPEIATTRIELVMKPGLGLEQMKAMNNSLSPLNLSVYVPLKETHSQLFRMFIAAAQVHGVHDMLLMLDEGTRKKYRKILDQSACPWWKPHELWGQWSELVVQTFSVSQPQLAPV